MTQNNQLVERIFGQVVAHLKEKHGYYLPEDVPREHAPHSLIHPPSIHGPSIHGPTIHPPSISLPRKERLMTDQLTEAEAKTARDIALRVPVDKDAKRITYA